MKRFFIFLLFSIFIFSENDGSKSIFLNVGNMKIVREQKIKIEKEVINIKFLENGKIFVKTKYFLGNLDDRSIKETYLFSLDQILGDKSNTYIEKINFFSNEKNIKHLRAVINFDEDGEKMQREWFSISSMIVRDKPLIIEVSYIIKNLEKKEFNYSFNIKNNFLDNRADLLEINIDGKNKNITSMTYQGYEFIENKDGTYYFYGKDVKLEDVLNIKYE